MNQGESRVVEYNTTRTVTRTVFRPDQDQRGRSFLYEIIRNQNTPDVVTVFLMILDPTRAHVIDQTEGVQCGGIPQDDRQMYESGKTVYIKTPYAPEPIQTPVIEQVQEQEAFDPNYSVYHKPLKPSYMKGIGNIKEKNVDKSPVTKRRSLSRKERKASQARLNPPTSLVTLPPIQSIDKSQFLQKVSTKSRNGQLKIIQSGGLAG